MSSLFWDLCFLVFSGAPRITGCQVKILNFKYYRFLDIIWWFIAWLLLIIFFLNKWFLALSNLSHSFYGLVHLSRPPPKEYLTPSHGPSLFFIINHNSWPVSSSSFLGTNELSSPAGYLSTLPPGNSLSLSKLTMSRFSSFKHPCHLPLTLQPPTIPVSPSFLPHLSLRKSCGTLLVIWWLRICLQCGGCWVPRIPGFRELRSHMPLSGAYMLQAKRYHRLQQRPKSPTKGWWAKMPIF